MSNNLMERLAVTAARAAAANARRKALEEVASPKFLRPLIEKQSAGEWYDETIDEDVTLFATAILALIDKEETGISDDEYGKRGGRTNAAAATTAGRFPASGWRRSTGRRRPRATAACGSRGGCPTGSW